MSDIELLQEIEALQGDPPMDRLTRALEYLATAEGDARSRLGCALMCIEPLDQSPLLPSEFDAFPDPIGRELREELGSLIRDIGKYSSGYGMWNKTVAGFSKRIYDLYWKAYHWRTLEMIKSLDNRPPD